MKLALLTPQYAPRFEGGTESVVRAQARALKERGHELRVISGTDEAHRGQDVETEEVDGIAVSFVPRLASEPYDLGLERPRVAALIDELVAGVELVHLHHWSTLDGEAVRRLSQRVPVVVTLHDLFVTCPRFFRVPHATVAGCPERDDWSVCARCLAPDAPGVDGATLELGLAARWKGFRAELEAAAARVVPSRSHARRLAQWTGFTEADFRIVAHGLLAPLAARSRDDARPWDGMGELRILHLGNRTEVKGTADLVRALAALPAELRARTRLILLGDEVQEGFDAELRRIGSELSIDFAGPYDLASLGERHAAAGGAHLACLPSRVEESYGLVVDEAQALGLPVWVSDRGAPGERVGASGRVLPAEDPAAWTRALTEVLADPKLLAVQFQALPRQARTAADAALELEALYATL